MVRQRHLLTVVVAPVEGIPYSGLSFLNKAISTKPRTRRKVVLEVAPRVAQVSYQNIPRLNKKDKRRILQERYSRKYSFPRVHELQLLMITPVEDEPLRSVHSGTHRVKLPTDTSKLEPNHPKLLNLVRFKKIWLNFRVEDMESNII